MKWPEKPTCHTVNPVFKINEQVWQEPDIDDDPKGRPFRSCSYCGSIHPEDLVRFLQNGATVEIADMKYGWPHKFYINNVPNPRAGENCEIGYHSNDKGERTVDYGPAPATAWVKWYNEHFIDKGYDDEAFSLLSDEIRKGSGLHFMIKDSKLFYQRAVFPKS